jgi:hypothetical protein
MVETFRNFRSNYISQPLDIWKTAFTMALYRQIRFQVCLSSISCLPTKLIFTLMVNRRNFSNNFLSNQLSLLIFGIQHQHIVPYRGIRFHVCCASNSCLLTVKFSTLMVHGREIFVPVISATAYHSLLIFGIQY